MKLATKTFRKVFRLITRMKGKFDEAAKREMCLSGDGCRLYPESRIYNFQSQRGTIVIGKASHIRGELLVLGHGGKIQIGDNCYVGEHARIWSAASIRVGDRVLISHGVNIHDNDSHSLSAAARSDHFSQIIAVGHPIDIGGISGAAVEIESDVWIGFNATILKGVTVGKGAIVGAASVVTRDIAPYTIVAGNPAKVVGVAAP